MRCTWLGVYNKKLKNKIVCSPTVFARPLPSALPIPLLALWLFATWPAGFGSFGSRFLSRKLAPARVMFSLSLGHLGHVFLGDPNDLKAGAGVRDGFRSLGHLGHWVIVFKLAPGELSTWRYSPTRY